MSKNATSQTASKNSTGAETKVKIDFDELYTNTVNEWYARNRARLTESGNMLNEGKITTAQFYDMQIEFLREVDLALKDAGAKGKRCSITGEPYYGYGNNAYPFSGRCSDYANQKYVIPARLMGVTPSIVRSFGGNRKFVRIMDRRLGRI